jgi:hypothetical protein
MGLCRTFEVQTTPSLYYTVNIDFSYINWKNEGTNGWMDEWIKGCVSKDYKSQEDK